jgi:hypothetical protein
LYELSPINVLVSAADKEHDKKCGAGSASIAVIDRQYKHNEKVEATNSEEIAQLAEDATHTTK